MAKLADNTGVISIRFFYFNARQQAQLEKKRIEITRVFDNLQAVAEASGGGLADIVKLNIFLTDLGNFPTVNEIMATYFQQPYPARAAIGIASLPKGVGVEMDAVLVLA